MWKIGFLRLLALLICFTSSASFAELSLMLESGAAWQQRNDLRVPSDIGTRLDFDKFDEGPFFHYRAELEWRFNEKHNVRAVYAPLNIS